MRMYDNCYDAKAANEVLKALERQYPAGVI
jgi:hypothetical protein